MLTFPRTKKMTRFSLTSRVNRPFLGGLAIVLVAASVTIAQSDPTESLSFRGPFYQPVSPTPVEMGFTQDHSSTYAEGAQRGRAAVIQALGNYQLSTSQASVIREQARALDRENCLKQTQALLAQKEMWSNAQIQSREQQATRIAEGKKKIAEQEANTLREIYQPAPTEFDAKTGAITWPTVLRDDKYQSVRTRVEELVRVQVGYGDPQPGTAKEIARNIDSMRRTLARDVDNIPKDDYLAASKFLVGLKMSAKSLGV
jgi:hypothetical protein